MRWTLKKQPSTTLVAKLSEELSIDRVLASILAQRGVTNFSEAKHFFRPQLSDLHNPFLMKDMDIAVGRIQKAIQNQENILIYGDYDVDGTTAVSLVSSYLKTFYPNVTTYIPDRYQEGYGVSFKGIDFAHDNDFSLIIALDCGIKAIEKVAYANTKYIDFIICDHHKPDTKIPKAIAVLNPKRLDCNYPYKELCGCGVGFKLIQALASNRNQTIEDVKGYLDLVAVATAADIVPITGENRVLAYYGLQIINTSPRNGIRAIIQQTKKEQLTITDVVFTIAPRINAAGRIHHGNFAVELLTELDYEEAKKVALKIEVFNTERRSLDAQITQQALQQIKDNKEEEKFATVVYDENWHKGVIGIVASRLIESYYRPTVVFTKSNEKLAASVRSVNGFDVYNALEQCSSYIEQFGGHKYAAGLTVLPENFENFKTAFEQVVKNTIDKNLLIPEIVIDAEINFTDITPKFFRILQQFAPFGPNNRKPVFKTINVKDTGYAKQVGSDKSHLKLSVIQDNQKQCFQAIGFGLGNEISKINDNFEIVYALDENSWNGNTNIQLLIKDIH